MKTEITEGNRLIDLMLGREPMNWNPSHAIRDYHNDWQKIMIAIEYLEESLYLQVEIKGKNCFIYWMGAEPEDAKLLAFLTKFNGIDIDSGTKLSATYTAVVTFIEHFNNLKG